MYHAGCCCHCKSKLVIDFFIFGPGCIRTQCDHFQGAIFYSPCKNLNLSDSLGEICQFSHEKSISFLARYLALLSPTLLGTSFFISLAFISRIWKCLLSSFTDRRSVCAAKHFNYVQFRSRSKQQVLQIMII